MIFFGVQTIVGSLDSELVFIPTLSINMWMEEVTNPVIHFAAIQKYRDYCAQMYDWIRQLTFEKKERDCMKFNAGVREIFHKVRLLIMVH